MEKLAAYCAKFAYALFYDPKTEYGIYRYQSAEDHSELPKGKDFVVHGYNLPKDKKQITKLYGNWAVDARKGKYFNAHYTELVLPTDEDGIIAYLKSLKVRVGNKTAKRIYDAFGKEAWELLEHNPEAFLQIKGITPETVQKIKEKTAETSMIRHIMERYRNCAEMTENKAVQIFEAYKANASKMLETQPYALYKDLGFDFHTVEAFAKYQPNWKPTDEARLLTGVQVVFDDAGREGHTCLPKSEAISRFKKRLDVSETVAKRTFNYAFRQKECIVKGDYCYSPESYMIESGIADDVKRLLKTQPVFKLTAEEVEVLIAEFETENSIKLADEQKEAVITCFRRNLSIITGGPGTGKSTIIKAVMFVAEKAIKDCQIMLMAPTGRAAKRMRETTQHNACTLHSGLGIRYNAAGKGEMPDTEPLDTNMIIVDETSMMDQFITGNLFKRIGNTSSVVLVGDADQLPSVSAGNVLRELTESGQIPSVRLNTIFRQQAGNPVIVNSRKILVGNTNLETANSFRLYESNDSENVFNFTCKFYEQCVRQFGIENVILLIPFRQSGYICTDTLNRELEARLNPPKSDERVLKCAKKAFRAGDKIMQTKNTDYAKNGDIGFIREIYQKKDPDSGSYNWVCEIQFEDESTTVTYSVTDMLDIDWAYAQTIHKSQGSEYKTVITVMTNEHINMAKRNLIYTAVTRAKENFVFIGQKEALHHAIRNNIMKVRYTRLAEFLNEDS